MWMWRRNWRDCGSGAAMSIRFLAGENSVLSSSIARGLRNIVRAHFSNSLKHSLDSSSPTLRNEIVSGRAAASSKHKPSVTAASRRHPFCQNPMTTMGSFPRSGGSVLMCPVTLASTSVDGSIKLWEVSSGKQLAELKGHSGEVTPIAFSPDGRTLASVSNWDQPIQLWDIYGSKQPTQLEGNNDGVTCVAFSPDGKTLAGATDNKLIKLWNVSSKKQLAELSGHSGGVAWVAFSPDGRTLASAGMDHSIRLWDVASGNELAELRGHDDIVMCVAFSPDGNTLASASMDHLIWLWHAKPKRSDTPHNDSPAAFGSK